MSRIVHLSDLHYGTEITAVEQALRAELTRGAYELLVVSGDLTQRARRSQFRRARAFLGELAAPKLIVPGNHDMPLYDLPRRFSGSLNRYRHYISDTLYPRYEDKNIAVFGVNTGRAFLWKDGTISRTQIARIRDGFAIQPRGRTRVLVTHHPLFAPPSCGHRLHRWAQRLLDGLGEFRPDVVLSGHLHVSYLLDVPVANPEFDGRTMVVQAGTALSDRQRGEPNAFNYLNFDAGGMTVEVRAFDGGAFTTRKRLGYRRVDGCWSPTPEPVDVERR